MSFAIDKDATAHARLNPKDTEQVPPNDTQKQKPTSFFSEWSVPIGLIALGLFPVAAGMFRLGQLGIGATITPENARFFAAPIPIVVHLISVSILAVLGAFQFARNFRRRRRGWHRAAGRLLIPASLAVALSGLWMSHFFDVPWYDGQLLYWIRMVVGSAMVLFTFLGVWAIRQRNFVQHGAWMTRVYALGMGAGTQIFTVMPWMLIPSIQTPLARGVLMGAGWMINVIVAEWVIRKR